MATPFPPYAFRPHEKPGQGFARVLRAISVRGRSLARRSREPVAESIHEARLLIKRTRALLWFARPALDAAVYARVRTQLREAAQLLARQRDLAVTQSTLEGLSQKASKGRDRMALAQTFQNLGRISIADEARKKSLRLTIKKAVGILCRALAGLGRSAVDANAWPSPADRVRKAFQATRKAGKKARRTEGDIDFHTWRKKAKRLLYELELTRVGSEKQGKRMMKRVAKLQDALGRDHDCVMAQEKLLRTLPHSRAAGRVADMLEKRKTGLRKKAHRLARRMEASI